MLRGKRVLLAITGSIAAYKAAMLVRILVKEGAEVRVIMTTLAKEFITPLTMATLSRNPILVDFFDPEDGRWNSHVSLGEWADIYLVAPATANTIAKMANGVADNLLLTTYLSARCPVFVAPAMDLDMYAHVATRRNIETLREQGVGMIEPEEGELASGLVGKGRMAEPEKIAEALREYFKKKTNLSGFKFLVTAGGTVEAIDLVRYISNHSTGKMGYAIAGELAERGAEVVLVSAPTALTIPRGVKRVDVESAEQMYTESVKAFDGDGNRETRADGAIMCAAVADYTPKMPSDTKIKKGDRAEDLTIELKQTKDIAAQLGKVKGGRLLVGFALEAENEVDNALSKMKRKVLDFIVLNSLREHGAGFGGDTNRVTILESNGDRSELSLASKKKIAEQIVDRVQEYILAQSDRRDKKI